MSPASSAALKPIEPVFTGELFAGLHSELMQLLRGLSAAAWERPTTAGAWLVRDVVAHLLDTALRRLSGGRDGHTGTYPPVRGYDDVLRLINELNAEWVRAADRLSPSVLTDLMAHVGPQAATYLASLDPDASATIGVAWAGQERSPNWLDVGREYTERWHHQDQIREAVGAPPLAQERWLRPVLVISLFALPHAYRDVAAERGTAVVLDVHGDTPGAWSLVRGSDGWELFEGSANDPRTRIRLDALAAARILMHRLPPDAARDSVTIEGDERLGLQFLGARAVMV